MVYGYVNSRNLIGIHEIRMKKCFFDVPIDRSQKDPSTAPTVGYQSRKCGKWLSINHWRYSFLHSKQLSRKQCDTWDVRFQHCPKQLLVFSDISCKVQIWSYDLKLMGSTFSVVFRFFCPAAQIDNMKILKKKFEKKKIKKKSFNLRSSMSYEC